jgi:hypothetical protein
MFACFNHCFSGIEIHRYGFDVMTLPTDYSTWIALAPAHELDTIKAQILANIGDLGSVTSKNLLVELAARRRELAADRRRAIEDPDFGLADGEEAAYGG